MYLVFVSHYWEKGLSWNLVEYLLIQKHLWLLIDSISFIPVVCALQNGTRFICKDRLSDQVPGQWESSLRTKAETCWYPFKLHSMLRPCMRSRVKSVGITVPFGWGAVIQKHIDKERYFLDWKLSLVLYFGFVALGFLVWDERYVITMRDLEDVVIYPLDFTDEKTTPRKVKWLDQGPTVKWLPVCLGKITKISKCKMKQESYRLWEEWGLLPQYIFLFDFEVLRNQTNLVHSRTNENHM